LGRLILRLIEPTSGRIVFDGRDLATLGRGELRQLRQQMQIVFQDPYASLNPRMRVGSIVGEGIEIHKLAKGRQKRERLVELLKMVGLEADALERYPHEFSGAQRQRIGIARALAVEPRLIVCDEPVSALDVSIQAQIINLLQDLQRRLGLAYVFIAHDLAVVKHIASHVAVMYLGHVVEYADKRSLFAQPRHPYTQALLSAIPIPQPGAKRERMLLQGDVPNPIDPPSGCRFRTRCPYARERCAQEVPALRSTDGHGVACHFWEEIAPPPGMAAEAPANDRLVRLQAAFRTASEAAAT